MIAHCEYGYTTNTPLDILMMWTTTCCSATSSTGNFWEAEHGFPLRTLVPKRYLWKSAQVGARHRVQPGR